METCLQSFIPGDLLPDESIWLQHVSYQSVLNEISNTWVQRNSDINSKPMHKLDHKALSIKQQELSEIIELSRSLNKIIAQSLNNEWVFLLFDQDGNVIYAENDRLNYLTGLFYDFLTDSRFHIYEELLKGKTIEAEMHLMNCPLAKSNRSVIIPIFNYYHELQCIMTYSLFNSDQLTNDLRVKIWLGTLLIRERLISQQYTSCYTNSMINGITDCVLILDDNLNIIHINRCTLALLGTTEYDMIGKPITDFLDKRDQKNPAKIINADSISFRKVCKTITCSIIKQQALETLNSNRCQYMITFRPQVNDPGYSGISGRQDSPFNRLVGESSEMRRIITLAGRIAKKPSAVLIEGETGTGKELFARAIHEDSEREGPFVPVNCGALPRELMQSELFGYEDGAFTGAKKGGRIGKFELANHGTLFLDEIGEMPLDMQVSLLRILQDKTVTPLGSNSKRTVDVRIIAATNKNLRKMVEDGDFREDLYYRINVMNIIMPPLRQRPEDIPLIAQYLLKKLCRENNMNVPSIEKDVLRILREYDWPGNVRELNNAIEHALFISGNDLLTTDLLPSYLLERSDNNILRLNSIQDFEAVAIMKALDASGGNITVTAKELGITRATLYKKIRAYDIGMPYRRPV
jgi:transcriptional regulator with PAS, ATPase and Fis domain